MKKNFCMAAFVLFLSISFFGCTQKNSESDEFINVYSWGEFISTGAEGNINVNKEFAKKTGIRVNYKTFQNNEELFAKLLSGGSDYDVIIPSDYMVSRLMENNMLSKLDFKNIPNFRLIDNKFKNLDFDRENNYSVPYMWGLIGIFYNKNEVKEKEKDITWDILWDEKYKGRILMFDNARDSFALSLLRLGYPINTTDSTHWHLAANELIKQKPLIQAYVMDQIFDKMANGEAALAPYYSGDAATMIKNNPNIGFVIPESGTNLFVDSLCVPKNSVKKAQAEKYINFMCETEMALANVKQTGYSTPHREAYQKLDNSIKQNKIFYPDDETLKNAQIFINLPNSINKLIDELWIGVKSGEAYSSPWMLVVILLGFAIIYIAVILYKKFKTNGL